MSLVVAEKKGGRTGDAQSAEVVYTVTGTGGDAGTVTDEDAFNAVLGSAPATWNGMPGANISINEELVTGTIWEVSAQYSASEPGGFNQSGATQYEFSFQAPQERIYQSLYTRGVYDLTGLLDRATFAPLYNGAINVKNDDGALSVEGLDLPAGTPTNTWIYSPFAVSDSYQMSVESIMGAVSNTVFKNRAALTMRLVGVDGGATFAFGQLARWNIRYAFQFSANRTNFTAGGITIPFKGGHDLLWGYYEDSFIDETRFAGVIKKPSLMFVEQVFPEVNMNVLGI